MKAGMKIIIGTIVLTVLVLAAIMMIPVPTSWHDSSLAFHVPLAMYTAVASLNVGAAILFLTSLSSYKAQLRRAYVAISAAIVLTAIGTLQLPILNGFDKWDSVWATSGIVSLPFLLSGLVMYLGMRSFGRLINAQSIFTKASIVVPAVIILSAGTILLPHVATTTAEKAFDASNIILAWSGLLDLAAALILIKVRQHIGAHYAAAMSWLAVALFTSFFIIAVVILDALLTTNRQDIASHSVEVIAVILSFMWIRAGYAFTGTKDL
jgi:hypothetical protein